jgi:hypothetical protein
MSSAEKREELLGRRVRLVFTDDAYTDLQPGATGTIDHVDDLGTLFVKWDDGSTLGLIPGRDRYEFIDQAQDETP